ncbi:NYN domain-containing protein [Vibrio pomeroyi]|uniref:NYN domain-containing protein n=1 Tax=Vibrio pomeroyi TaxID=198832 RepID=A0ABV4MRJ8_9VIBR|nr:NYN domain-containing protein [Vibrio atlanticus]MCZ4310147.1 NYN domain-containing protein [Vibrio atlanticus]
MRKTICLIDAENVSFRKVEELLTHIRNKGELIEVRAYGDFTRRAMKGWHQFAKSHRMTVVNQPGAVAGKNSSDISLVVDAMDLLHERHGEFNAFALLTSDSDFAVLTRRVRRDGIQVDGYGEAKAPESFREACNNYYEHTEALKDNKQPKGLTGAFRKLVKLLKRAIALSCKKDGWAKISNVGRDVRSINPSVSHRDFGVKRFGDLFRNEKLKDLFEVRRTGDVWEVKLAM